MPFNEQTLVQASEVEMDYEKFLKIKRVDIDPDLKGAMLKFAIADNYNIFITSQPHEHIFSNYGVDPEKTLAESYVFFDKDGLFKNVQFKIDSYQKSPAFNGNSYQLAQLKKAASAMLEKSFGKK